MKHKSYNRKPDELLNVYIQRLCNENETLSGNELRKAFIEVSKESYFDGVDAERRTNKIFDEAMITTITNALNYLEELNDSKGHDNVPSQYQSEKDWLKSIKQRIKENKL